MNHKSNMMIKINLNTRKFFLPAILGIILCLFIFAFAPINEDKEKKAQPSSTLQVEISHPVYDSITEWDEYTGRFEASQRAEVRARVSGFLESVDFTDGQYVEKGQVLFTLDQRPYKIELNRAKANFAQAMATLKTAQDNFSRVTSLKETGAVSTEEYDRRKQALVHAQATKLLAQAQVDDAQLNLEFTKIKAPISGVVSRDRVNEGNLIDGGSANSTLLTTIVATNPIHFYFTGSESEHLKYVRLSQKEFKQQRTEGVPVNIKLSDEKDFIHQAQLDFIDNEIAPNSGTIERRAIVENKDHLLEPGMFGKARIKGSKKHNAIMVPDQIIGTNQSLRYVYILGKDNTVNIRTVSLGPLHANGLRIIREGLAPTDKIIINNLQKIRPGVVVTSKMTDIENNQQEK